MNKVRSSREKSKIIKNELYRISGAEEYSEKCNGKCQRQN
jgi:hypothetical protein